MTCRFVKHWNQDEQRTEYWMTAYEYDDGIDRLAEFFIERFAMCLIERFTGMYSNRLVLQGENTVYTLLWHEDVGNYLYSEPQSEEMLRELEERLNAFVEYAAIHYGDD